MHGTTYETDGFKELAQRENDGIEISLVWNRQSNGLTVFVCDTRTHDLLELEVEPAEALDVFRHPYAFAAFRGLMGDAEALAP